MLDPYTKLYQQIKQAYLADELKDALHYPFCEALASHFGISIIACNLVRLPHNGRLHLEIISWSETDQSVIDQSDYTGIKIKDVEFIRNTYLQFAQTDQRIGALLEALNVSTAEIEALFVIASPFVPALIWDLNINLAAEKQECLFDQHFKGYRYKVLKEFNVVVLLLEQAGLDQLPKAWILDKLPIEYRALLQQESPVPDIIKEQSIVFFVEELESFDRQFGNLRNYLN